MRTPALASPLFATLILVSVARADDALILRRLDGEISPAVRAIQADNHLGNVRVTGVASGFGWEWTLRSRERTSGRAEAYARECRVEVLDVNGVLKVKVFRPENERGSIRHGHNGLRRFLSWATLGAVSAGDDTVHSDLTLRIPMASAVDVRNRFGSVHVSSTRGAANVDCQNGRVELMQVEGAVTARTSFGTLRAHHVGPADLTTQNGPVDVRDVAGDLRATTSFARLQARAVKGDAVLRNQNGAIEAARITGNLTAATSFSEMRIEEIGGRADLKSQNTRVEVKNVTGEVAATTSFGTMRVQDIGSRAVLRNQNGLIEALRVTGDLVAETSFADLRADEIGGKADLECRNGKVEVARVTREVRVVNSFGPIRIREIGGGAELAGRNSDIVAAGVTGDVWAQTSHAKLRIEGDGPRFQARNQNGPVEIVARSTAVQQIDASASFATIDVRLPAEAKPLIRAATSHGKVHSNFPVLHADSVSDARFAAESSPLKVSLKGQNGDIRIQTIAVR